MKNSSKIRKNIDSHYMEIYADYFGCSLLTLFTQDNLEFETIEDEVEAFLYLLKKFIDSGLILVVSPLNGELLTNVANDANNILGNDKFGNTWSAKLLDTGEQVWTQTRNGQIINGGINKVPKQFNSETGLSSPIRPNWK